MATCHGECLACPRLTIGQDGTSVSLQHLGGDLTNTLRIDHFLTRIMEVLCRSVCVNIIMRIVCVGESVCLRAISLVPYLVGSSSLAVGC